MICHDEIDRQTEDIAMLISAQLSNVVRLIDRHAWSGHDIHVALRQKGAGYLVNSLASMYRDQTIPVAIDGY